MENKRFKVIGFKSNGEAFNYLIELGEKATKEDCINSFKRFYPFNINSEIINIIELN